MAKKVPKDPVEKLLARTKILRAPVHRLSTFGATRIDYHVVSDADFQSWLSASSGSQG